jgi:tRNA threonylcarbamoyl adenosine modification protein YeaZ
MILAIDTATIMASLALYDERADLLLAEHTWHARRRHTQELVPAVEALLARATIPLDQIDTLAVTTGPGSFTGVRVGISAVKGMVEGRRLAQRMGGGGCLPQVVGVPVLTVTAAPWLDAAWSISPPPVICACIQAGRGRYNWCFFGAEDLLFRPPAEAHHSGTGADLGAALAAHRAALWLAGEVDDALRREVAPLHHVAVIDSLFAQRRAANLARVAALLLAEGVTDEVDSLQPLYLRPPS